MATVVYTNAKIFIGGYDLSADHSELGLDYASELQDVTTFGQDTRIKTGGLETASVSGNGFWNGGTNNADQAFFNFVSATGGEYSNPPLVLFGNGITEGAELGAGYAMKATIANYNIGNTVGDMLTFDITAESAGIK